jgi:poly-gamma-glutamate synthesis protein (capsule biosynthesis protein)
MIHWGEERVYSATDAQVAYGRALVDAGADLVLGSHSHVVGGIELYNGKYIVYGLGNFCFGGNSNPSDKDAMIFQQTFVLDPDAGIVDGGISVIPVSTSSVAYANDYRPTPLSGMEARRVLRKIDDYSTIGLDEVKWAKGMNEYLALAD